MAFWSRNLPLYFSLSSSQAHSRCIVRASECISFLDFLILPPMVKMCAQWTNSWLNLCVNSLIYSIASFDCAILCQWRCAETTLYSWLPLDWRCPHSQFLRDRFIDYTCRIIIIYSLYPIWLQYNENSVYLRSGSFIHLRFGTHFYMLCSASRHYVIALG